MFNNKTNKQRPTKNTEKNNKKPNQTPKNPPSKQPKNKQQQKHSKEEEYWCKTWGLRKELDKSDSTEWMWFKKKGFRIKRKILFISCSLMCSERDKIEYWFLERYDYALKIIKKKKKKITSEQWENWSPSSVGTVGHILVTSFSRES